MSRRYRHYWTCDTCGKFVQVGAVRCATCTYDVPAKARAERLRMELLDARMREIDRAIAEERS